MIQKPEATAYNSCAPDEDDLNHKVVPVDVEIPVDMLAFDALDVIEIIDDDSYGLGLQANVRIGNLLWERRIRY